MDYTKLKEAITEAGFTVSSGTEWTAQDDATFRDYCYFKQTNVDAVRAAYGLAYPSILEEITGVDLVNGPEEEPPVEEGQGIQSMAFTPEDESSIIDEGTGEESGEEEILEEETEAPTEEPTEPTEEPVDGGSEETPTE